MRYLCALFIFLISVIVSGCFSSENKNPVENAKPFPVKDTKLTLEQQFIPPNFKASTFSVRYNRDPHELVVQMDYLLSEKLCSRLKMINKDYFFCIEFPESIEKITGVNHTELIAADRVRKNLLSYRISCKIKIAKKISNPQENYINTHQLGYKLHIADHEKDIIHTFDDIYEYTQ